MSRSRQSELYGERGYGERGGTGALVTVRLSAAPEREVVIPLTAAADRWRDGTGRGGCGLRGCSGEPHLRRGETEKTFTVTALDDSIDDDDEGVTLSFGARCEGVTLGSEATATVSLIDADDPAVTVTFAGELYGERGWCGGDRDTERCAEARGGALTAMATGGAMGWTTTDGDA